MTRQLSYQSQEAVALIKMMTVPQT